jgi:hypothetical protein
MTDQTPPAEGEYTEGEQPAEQTGTQAAPNDPTQTGSEAELTDEQRANAASENATQGDQGPQVREQDAQPVGGDVAGFDPNRPVASSPPPPDAQSGVPQLADGSNAGVEPGEQPGPVSPAAPAEGGSAPSPEGE